MAHQQEIQPILPWLSSNTAEPKKQLLPLREILVLGGTHGEEEPGIKLVRSLRRDKILGVEGMIASPAAVRNCRRCYEENLALSYPGTWWDGTYESDIANRIIRVCYGYDLVVDVHSCETTGGHYAIVGEQTSELVLKAIAFMGIRRLLVLAGRPFPYTITASIRSFPVIVKWCTNRMCYGRFGSPKYS
ncbi:MAG TPA: succinylglutamate desuccinylase/aspartoacylase family protein [Candidatus Saccharimonadales bacterium]|nr:succinylglutamate desuccinylase/aspartoacylase family protein [Candidatus Saccharimonadales bacterium]